MSTLEQIKDDLKSAMKALDKQKTGALRLITAAVKQIEVDERIEIDSQRLLTILEKMAKQRKEAIEQYKKANREDLIQQEEYELQLISSYLPDPLSTDEIKSIVIQSIKDVGAQSMPDIGKVITHLKPKVQGRADMGEVTRLLREELQKG